MDKEKLSERSRKSAATRKKNNPNVFVEMGRKGGSVPRVDKPDGIHGYEPLASEPK